MPGKSHQHPRVSAKDIFGNGVPEDVAERFIKSIAKARRDIENDGWPKGKALEVATAGHAGRSQTSGDGD